jgi:hypothetical protein
VIKLTTDKAAAVDTEYFWLDAKKFPPPRSARVLCISDKLRVAHISQWGEQYGFTHWCPLPTFAKEN